MKQIKRYASIGLAAVLLTGCAKQSQQPEHAEDYTWEDGTLLHLTDQSDEPGMHGFAQTGSGMFFPVYRSVTDSQGFSESRVAFKYFDAESGQTAWLCARPNCLHDGDEFCTATTSNYEILTDPVWLDGYVYAVAQDHSAQLSQSNLKYTTVLLQYAPDGTGITKVADIHAEPQQEEDELSRTDAILIAHRGQLWMKCAYTVGRDYSDKSLNIAKYETLSGYDICMYAPSDGKLTRLHGTDSLQKDFHAWSDDECLLGSGDYVYFLKKTGWQDPLKGEGVFRIDCRTGVTEQAVKPKNGCYIRSFSAAGDKIVCYEENNINTEDTGFVAYDPASGEETPLMTAQALFETQYPGEAAWRSEFEAFVFGMHPFYLENLFCDESHVMIVWQATQGEDGLQTYLTICDWSGEIEQTVKISQLASITDAEYIENMLAHIKAEYGDDYSMTPEAEEKYRTEGVEEWFGSACYADGLFYLRGWNQICTLSLADALEDKTDYRPLFIYEPY